MLQSTSGQLALWQATGVTLSASGLLNPDPGPTWSEKGTGSFFTGDTSDILWQSTDGTVAVWQEQAVCSSQVTWWPTLAAPGR
jgi:hypothetical protein